MVLLSLSVSVTQLFSQKLHAVAIVCPSICLSSAMVCTVAKLCKIGLCCVEVEYGCWVDISRGAIFDPSASTLSTNGVEICRAIHVDETTVKCCQTDQI